MRIAMIGTRGIPGGYSGFETAVEELSVRLAARGHDVTVYCRPHVIKYQGEEYKGVKLVKLPTVPEKHLDTFAHTCISTFHAMIKGRYDVAIYFIAGNSPFVFLPRLTGVPTALNVDGLDSQREKWSAPAKFYLRLAERLAPIAATQIITDSQVVRRYYQDRFGASSVYIPYGADMPQVEGTKWLDRFGIEPREYILFVGRLVPENCAHVLVEAFRRLDTDEKLVIVGDAPYADEYIRELKRNAGKNVIFTGYVFGEGYRQLSQNALLFVVPTVVGGTHPVIVEALAAGNCVIVSDHEPNLETVGDAGISFSARMGAADLGEKISALLANPEMIEKYRVLAKERAQKVYNWDKITEQYEQLCNDLVKKKRAGNKT
ncbi:MAG: glycosyltransferase [Thermoleophilia bacterium]|nr:glycosyltransferase [Thermoleophilia bacterium]